jgi:hypothetical protein
MRKSVTNHQVKALGMAIGGASVAAVATMFVPTPMLESFTGATGLSELFPAAAAPLGDTARATIAFGTGVFTLAVLAFMLLRQDNAPLAAPPATLAEEAQQSASFKDRLARITLPKMPWNKGDDDITELGDLPKLRNHDSHPDAPARRPLSAHLDLPVLDLSEVGTAIPEAKAPFVSEIAAIEVADDTPIAEVAPMVTVEVDTAPIAPAAMTPADIQPTLAEMVAQLEAAVAERQSQLAELEAVAAQLGAGQVPPAQIQHAPAEVEVPLFEPAAQSGRAERPPLSAVPLSVKDDDMDSALAAALATLHRMNGTNN